MSEELIKQINSLAFHDNMEQSIKTLLVILSNDWMKGLTSLKRSQILINKFGNNKKGDQITCIINSVSNAVPKKYKNRYWNYFSTIIPLNNLLQDLSKRLTKSEFWLLDKEVCLTSLLARFEAVYAHVDHNATTLLNETMEGKDALYLGRPYYLRADDGSLVEVDRKVQQLAASLDRNLRFIEFYLNKIPLANLESSLYTYKAGAFEIAGELWNAIFYLVDKVSLFDWYATETGYNPKTLYFQPSNKNQHILQVVGGLRETQWLLQQRMDTAEQFQSIKHRMVSNDPLVPRNEMEFRVHVELSEMCHNNKILEVAFKNELKVKEYIRAWFAITEIAEEHFALNKQVLVGLSDDALNISNLLVLSIESLMTLLIDKGKLTEISAKKSIELLSYWNMDRDVYSSPLFPTIDGRYLILSSIFLTGNPVRSVFRLLSYDEIDISFKGISSEKELGKIFSRMGFACLTSYAFHDESGPGDIDCIAYKEGIFIVVESKNIVPNESTYDRYRTTALFTQKASNQANRAKRFVKDNLSLICEKLSIKITDGVTGTIFPVIITNLFDFTGLVINGVPVCDFSALGKFASSKYVYRTIKNKEGTSRVPYIELYNGEMPTAEEVLVQLKKPFQIAYQAKKLMATSTTQRMTDYLTLQVFDVKEKEVADEEIDFL